MRYNLVNVIVYEYLFDYFINIFIIIIIIYILLYSGGQNDYNTSIFTS